jgi:hypothetical protein
MLPALLLLFGQTTETSMQFVKIDSLGKNPVTAQLVIYKQSVKEKLTQSFQKCPVFMMVATPDKKEQLIQVGMANCIYSDGQWIRASLTLNKEVPSSYVLRAVFVHNDSRTKDNVEEVAKASITEFVLKPKEKSTIFD